MNNRFFLFTCPDISDSDEGLPQRGMPGQKNKKRKIKHNYKKQTT
jgi:hypothetical protein